MNLWDKVTGNDMNREYTAFAVRARELPPDYQAAWETIQANIWPYADFTGRNLMPILDGALGLLEETAADGQSVQEALGDDIKGFCSALCGEEGAKNYRDKWRQQLNNAVAKKLRK
jgi:DNA-binding ferritin-like protein (Dps family)